MNRDDSTGWRLFGRQGGATAKEDQIKYKQSAFFYNLFKVVLGAVWTKIASAKIAAK